MRIKAIYALPLLLIGAVACKKGLSSPDGSIAVGVDNQTLTVTCNGVEAFGEIHLGLVTENSDLDSGLELKKVSRASKVSVNYEMLAGKRKLCSNQATEKTLTFKNPQGEELQVIVRAYDDGIAFRYVTSEGTMVTEDRTYYEIPAERRERMHLARRGEEIIYRCEKAK